MPRRRTRVLYLQYANPAAYPPVVHGAHILAEHGAEVRLVGTRPRKGGSIEMPGHPRIRVGLIDEGAGIGRKLAFVRFLLLSIWTTLRFRPDWVYVSDLFATPVGLVATRIARSSLVYHEHDVHAEASPSAFVRLCMATRRRVAQRAQVVIAPSEGRGRHLRETVGVAVVHVVLNCPRRKDVRERRSAESGPVRLVYQGTIVPQRLPLALADAIAEFGGAITLTLAGYEPPGAEGHIAALTERAAARGAPDSIRYAGLLTVRAELLDLCAEFDAGLAFVPLQGGDVNMETMAGASNKAFDYLACGVPMLVSDKPDWKEMFVQPGYARALRPDDAASVITSFRWLLEHRAELHEMGAAGRRRILAEWNYERQFASVVARLIGPLVDAREAAA